MPPAFDPAVVELLSYVLGELPDPVRLIDRNGKKLCQNEASRLTAPEGLGHLCGGDGTERNASCPACQLDDALERGLFQRWHVVVPRPDRASDYFEITISPVRDDDGSVLGALEILRDATATLGLEQYLIGRSERAEDEVRVREKEAHSLKAELGTLRHSQEEILYRDRLMAISDLVANLAHEIHTPLGAMISSADLLQRARRGLHDCVAEIGEARTTALRRKLDVLDSSAGVIVDAARRIEGIIQTLRTFSRLDEVPRKAIDVTEGLESTLALLEHRFADRIHVARDYAELPPLTCRPDALNLVFMNLLQNAAQAIPGEGTIRVATRRDGAAVVIEVADTGVGFDEETGSRLFELGFTTRRGRGGSGLGLALSRRIVEDHGGTIRATGEPGAGATFRVRLPLDPETEEG